MVFPLNHSIPLYSSSFGIAKDNLHLLNPKRLINRASAPFSMYSFSPTIPISATPLATDCGISSSRKKSTSTGNPFAESNKVRFPLFSFIPASSRSIIVSSNNLPFDCTAIRNICLFFKLIPIYRQKKAYLER